jgi:hypothetical protein
VSDDRFVLAFVLGTQTSTLNDKEAVLELAKEYPAEVTAIGSALGKSLGPDGKWI